jgi:hypothetical protein
VSVGAIPSPASFVSFVAFDRHCGYRGLTTALSLFAACMGGCSRQAEVTSTVPPAVQHLGAVRDGFFEARRALDRPPRSKDEIVKYVEKFGDPAQMFRSPDDGEDFVVIYGIDPLAMDAMNCIWAYERHGNGSGRYVLRGRHVRRITDDEFRKQTFPPGHKPGL